MATFTPQVTKLAKIVPGYIKLGNFTKYPCTMHEFTKWNNFNNFWEFTPLVPQNPKITFKVLLSF